jgi:hypothetical protein
MRWSGLAKVLLGVILAIAILLGGGVATVLYFILKGSSSPPKPIFANDKPSVTGQRSPTSNTAKRTSQPTTANSTNPPATKPLAPGTYKARVTWSDGLSLRSEPNLDAERVGGAAYNEQVIVLGESADKNWQRIRLENGEDEGWIKAGNTQKVEDEQ